LKTSPGAISAGDRFPIGVNAYLIIIYAITFFAIYAPNLLLFQVRNDIFRLGVYSPNKRDIGGIPAKEYCRNRQF
jgi:hypothetical protein